MPIDLKQIQNAAQILKDRIVSTPCLKSQTLSDITGAQVYLKFENLQFTSSFKERGAIVKLDSLTDKQKQRGVVAVSAGNHAQAVAYHSGKMNLPATIVMPKNTPMIKIESTENFGAEVILHGQDFNEATQFALQLTQDRKAEFIPPYDDEKVIAGQGTVALEMLETVPNLDILIVPIGGGGLISGMATAAKSINPKIKIVGVQTNSYPYMHNIFYKKKTMSASSTIAEGIAVKKPGEKTRKIIKNLVNEILLVSEGSIEKAILLLLEIEKTVCEGAGAVGLATLLSYPNRWKNKRVGLVLCGGNIDLMTLPSIVQRGLVATERLSRITFFLQDHPGQLAKIVEVLANAEANIIEILHQRIFTYATLGQTNVQITIQTRGKAHLDKVTQALHERKIRFVIPKT